MTEISYFIVGLWSLPTLFITIPLIILTLWALARIVNRFITMFQPKEMQLSDLKDSSPSSSVT